MNRRIANKVRQNIIHSRGRRYTQRQRIRALRVDMRDVRLRIRRLRAAMRRVIIHAPV